MNGWLPWAIGAGVAAYWLLIVESTCHWRGHDWNPFTLICLRCHRTREAVFADDERTRRRGRFHAW